MLICEDCLEVFEGFGMVVKVLEGSGRFRKVSEAFGRFRKVSGGRRVPDPSTNPFGGFWYAMVESCL